MEGENATKCIYMFKAHFGITVHITRCSQRAGYIHMMCIFRFVVRSDVLGARCFTSLNLAWVRAPALSVFLVEVHEGIHGAFIDYILAFMEAVQAFVEAWKLP